MHPEVAKQLSDKTRKDYDALAEAMDVTRRDVWDELRDFIPAFKPGESVIDIGCGNGRMTQAIPDGVAYLGIDASPELIKKAKLRYPKANFQVGDALVLPFPDASFDHAFSIAVLHQIPGEEAREKAMREMARVLKSGGMLLITVWNLWQPKYLWRVLKSTVFRAFGQGKMDVGDVLIPWKGHSINRYYHAFRMKTVRRLLETHGFEIVKQSRGKNFVFLAKKR